MTVARRLGAVRLAVLFLGAAAIGVAACSKDATVPVIVQLPDYEHFAGESRLDEIGSYVLSVYEGTPGLCASMGPLGENAPMSLVTARVHPPDERGFAIDNLRGGRDQFIVLEGCRQPPEALEADPTLCDAVYRGTSVPGDYLAAGQTEPTGRKYDTIRIFFGRVGVFNPLRSRLTEGAFGGFVDLGNGKIVFAGGIGAGGSLVSNVYVFDRNELVFDRPIPKLSTARVFPSVAALPGGGALIAGGYATLATSGVQALDHAERLDRDGTPIEDSRQSMSSRAFAAAAPIGGGRIVIAGGVPGRDLLSPDQYADEWDESGFDSFQMIHARALHAGAPADATRALFTGGITRVILTNQPEVSATAELVTGGAGNTTTRIVTGILPRWGHTATHVPGGRVLVAGGASALPAVAGSAAGLAIANVTTADVFVTADGAFDAARAGVLAVGRAHHAAAALGNGDVLVTGGTRCAGALPGRADVRTAACGEPALPLASTEIWWGERSEFVPGPPLLVARYGHGAFHLGDGTVLVAGGIGTSGFFTPVAEIYVPTWRCSMTTSTRLP